ncbi:MAG: preprotein translocase subunit SecA [Proteobacteria bacterium]|nr:preprotein translocase subunit SecA [Pseudomonadota bacterium]
MINIFKSIFGTRNERLLRGLWRNVRKINEIEPQMQALTDAQLQAKTGEFKKRLAEGASLNDLLIEVFATVREASRRIMGMRHFDVQLIGGMVLHSGKISEMGTGEGKTLSATLAAYLNALTGRGVHVITVNDYLAKRDAEWMRPIYQFLGMSVAYNLSNMNNQEKKAAYAADITYGTNNEFGFDYLRDNMVFALENRVQRSLHYAIVDEVDSILIDEARTPLIISGQAEASSDLYMKIKEVVPHLKLQKMLEDQKEEELPEEQRGDYYLDEKSRQAFLTERGHEKVEKLLLGMGLLKEGDSLYDPAHISLMHYINATLRAHTLYQKDVHYVVKNNQVIIVDEHTGRLMDGRRWSDGLHQAVEAKENVAIQLENQTLATITLQNYFRLYDKLSGMTGTADTEAYEFQKIYGLEVVVIPPNRAPVRKDLGDQVFLTGQQKFKVIIEKIKELRQKQQPVLVGTASIENSEKLSWLLQKEKIPHQVLNAKQHEFEAKIIAEAGRPGTITIATNMAGRGTDIVLGGNLETELAELKNANPEEIERHKEDWKKRHETVLQAGGLHVLGTERHESRRIDNQLRGRSGRQGDPGSSQFYLSMEDNLLRIFAAERMANIMRRLGVQEQDVIEHPMITRAIERAQKRVEGINFDIRKNLLEYDDVANDQRKVIYQQRLELLESKDLVQTLTNMRNDSVNHMIDNFIPPQSLEEQWNISGLEQQIHQDFNIKLPISDWLKQDETLHEETLREKIVDSIAALYQSKIANLDAQSVQDMQKSIILQALDSHWRDHLAAMDHLRQGIHLRGYAQKNPAQEFKRESFNLFTEMLMSIKYEVVSTLSKVQLVDQSQATALTQPAMTHMSYQHAEVSSLPGADAPSVANIDQQEPGMQTIVRQEPKVGRNDPCPCGSGKKYKYCHGKL